MPMVVLSRPLLSGATPAQKRRADIRSKRVLALVLAVVTFSKPSSRSKRKPCMHMDWQARRDGLSNREFLKRYKLSKGGCCRSTCRQMGCLWRTLRLPLDQTTLVMRVCSICVNEGLGNATTCDVGSR